MLSKLTRAVLSVAAAGLVLLCQPQAAWAWRCSRVLDNSGTASGPALFWSNRAITYHFNSEGTTALDNKAAFDAVRTAFSVWQNSTLATTEPAGCPGIARDALPKNTDISFTEGPQTDQSYVGFNYLMPNSNRNVILFRDITWPHPLTEPTSDLVALTTVTYDILTGEILDADIEFNTADFTLTVGDDNVAFDLLGAAVHEVGHLLGFDDVTVDNAVMDQATARGATNKRQLSCDDAAILWYRYPTGLPTSTCKPKVVNDTCGFCAAPGGVAFDAAVKVANTYDGHSGCSCSSTGGSQGLLLCTGLVALRLLQRRPTRSR